MTDETSGEQRGDLSVTALYTAGAWAWAELPGAALYRGPDTDRVFAVVNGVLRLARWLTGRRGSLPHDLVHRHTHLDAWVGRLEPTAVLELAAGLSSRGARFTAEDPMTWVEVDLPAMVAHKTARLEASAAGREVLARSHLSRRAADVTTADLAELLPPTGSTLVLAEGLLMYLSPAERGELFRRVAAYLAPHGGWLAFDLVPPAEEPPPGRVGRMLGWLMRRFTGGADFDRAAETRSQIAAALEDAGFDDVEATAPADVAAAWGLPFPDRRTHQLVWLATVEAP